MIAITFRYSYQHLFQCFVSIDTIQMLIENIWILKHTFSFVKCHEMFYAFSIWKTNVYIVIGKIFYVDGYAIHPRIVFFTNGNFSETDAVTTFYYMS